MRYPILILGGYGNFGKRISARLARDQQIRVLIAGRSGEKAEALVRKLTMESPQADVSSYPLDLGGPDLAARIAASGARLVIHTCGPFQGQDYRVAEACMEAGADYIDLSDGRRFVSGIARLSERAAKQDRLVVSGASSVPGLSSAVVDELAPRFSRLRHIHTAIAPGNRAERGDATIRAILSYTGRPFERWQGGHWQSVYGWQNVHRHTFPAPVGRRWLASCDVPDLQLFPARYPGVTDVVFYAGLELSILHLTLWGMSWLARSRLIDNWARYAHPVTAMGRWFEPFGTNVGGMFVSLEGEDAGGQPLRLRWTLIAEHGHGPEIPAIPAVILAKKLATGTRPAPGAKPCLGLFTLTELMAELADLPIHHHVEVA